MPYKSSMSNSARETIRDARGATMQSAKAAAAAVGNIQADLENLRDDVGRVAQQLTDIFANRGQAVWQRARSSMSDTSRQAAGAAREAGDDLIDAIQDSLGRRPYQTLAVAAGIGFLIWAVTRYSAGRR